MSDLIEVIAIDAGNTAVKLGHFVAGKLTEVQRVSRQEFFEHPYLASTSCKQLVLSSVLDDDFTHQLKALHPTAFVVENKMHLPFDNLYEQPEQLGLDRLCNAAFAFTSQPKKNTLVIDLGTCIKFDFMNEQGAYLGGSISPGIRLRYAALNHYTDKLPLLDLVEHADLIGNSTRQSIHAGVLQGIQAEIQGMMSKYDTMFSELHVYLTGGDVDHFDFARKNNIFVDQNLTLKGLYYLYVYQTLHSSADHL